MDPLKELIELEALKTLKARYFFFLDTKQWDSWLALFAPDATLKWDAAASTRGRDGQTGEMFVGIDQIRKHVVEGILDPAQTVHQGHTPILELTSETTATGIWAMEDILTATDKGRTLHAYGHYRETYRKMDGKWRITSLHLTRLRVITTSL
jgi:hypothetical protein